MERGWVLCCAEEAAKIHYLSVLYLFHMLLLSNLSLQILDSENKQRDQSSRSLQANVPLQTPQRRTAAALPTGWRQKCRETRTGWMIDARTADTRPWVDGVRLSKKQLEEFEDRRQSCELYFLFCRILCFGPGILDPLGFYSSHYHQHPPPLHCSPFFLGGLEFIPDNPPQFRKWNERDSVKCGIMDGLPRGKIASLLSDLSEGVWVL